MIKEKWSPMVNYKGYYEISNLGRIKRVKFGRGCDQNKQTLKPFLVSGGYLMITPSKNNKAPQKYVHVLVLESFVSCRPKNKEVNHINGIKTDNRLSNLEWATRTANCLHSTRVLKKNIEENHGRAKLKNKDILLIRKMLKKGETQKSLARIYGVHQGTISKIKRNFTWRFV